MAINFPDSPTIGDEFTGGGFTWTWSGSSWEKVSTSTSSGASENYFLIKSNLDFFDTTSLGSGLFIVTIAADSGSFASPVITFYDENNSALATFNSVTATYYSSVTVSKIKFTNTSNTSGRATIIHGPVNIVNVLRINATKSVTLDAPTNAYVFGGGGGGGGGAPASTAGGGGGGGGYLATGTLAAGTYTVTIGAGGNRGYYGNGQVGVASSVDTIVGNGGNPGEGGASGIGGSGGSGGGAGGNGTLGAGGLDGANGESTNLFAGGIGSSVAIPSFAGNYPSSLILPESALLTFYAGGSGSPRSSADGTNAASNSASGGNGGYAASGQVRYGGNGGSGVVFLVGA